MLSISRQRPGLLPADGEGAEDLGRGAFILGGVLGLADLLEELLAPLKEVPQVAPELLHVKDGVAPAAEGLQVAAVEGVVEGGKILPARARPAPGPA